MGNIHLCNHITRKELPTEVKEFFIKLRREHEAEFGTAKVIEALNIRVGMHCDYAIIESETSSFDKTKHYLEQ